MNDYSLPWLIVLQVSFWDGIREGAACQTLQQTKGLFKNSAAAAAAAAAAVAAS
jgi:hypothetical protein